MGGMRGPPGPEPATSDLANVGFGRQVSGIGWDEMVRTASLSELDRARGGSRYGRFT
jgi:hypothetical protein